MGCYKAVLKLLGLSWEKKKRRKKVELKRLRKIEGKGHFEEATYCYRIVSRISSAIPCLSHFYYSLIQHKCVVSAVCVMYKAAAVNLNIHLLNNEIPPQYCCFLYFTESTDTSSKTVSKDSYIQYGYCCEHKFNAREMLLLRVCILYKLQHICHIQKQSLFKLESYLLNSKVLSS